MKGWWTRVGMSCPRCGTQVCSVIRTNALPSVVIRIRRCEKCGQTFETVEHSADIDGLLRISVAEAAETLRQMAGEVADDEDGREGEGTDGADGG